MADTITTTVALAFGSLVIALVLGTALAWAATRLPPRLSVLRALPILPIVVPAVASVIGWSFLLSPRPGYLNALMRQLPWWSDLDSGPLDVYTMPWIILITGFGLTAFVYLFVSTGLQNINSELIEAAQVSGSRPLGVFFRVTLPLLRPVLVYGGGVALLLGLGQFTGPLLLGRQAGISVLTTDMYLAVSAVSGRLRSRRRHRLAAPAVRPCRGDRVEVPPRRPGPFRDPRRQGVPFAGPPVEARHRRHHRLLPPRHRVARLRPHLRGPVEVLERRHHVSEFTLDNLRQIFAESGIVDAIVNSVTLSFHRSSSLFRSVSSPPRCW